MKKGNGNQSGFSAVGVVIIILVLAILAGAGVWVWHHNKKTVAPTSSSSQQASQSTNTTKPSTLTITEWNVQATSPAELGVVSYSFVVKDSLDLSSSLSKHLPASCVDKGGDGTDGTGISRFNDNAQHGNPDATKKIGSYTYYLYLEDGVSPLKDCSDTVTVQKLNTDYTTLFNNLQAL